MSNDGMPTLKRRARVCSYCVYLNDDILGYVHSELSCTRCGQIPCVGCIVEYGTPPLAGQAAFNKRSHMKPKTKAKTIAQPAAGQSQTAPSEGGEARPVAPEAR